jgi:hypothetical protein
MKSRLALVALLLAIALPSGAQTQVPKPSPEVKKLDYFVGTWTLTADLKPGPMGPGGKMIGTEHYDWMDGGYFIVGQSEYTIPGMGAVKGPSFLGYDPNDNLFTYDAFNTMGQADHAKGTFAGDTWTYTSEEKMGPQTLHARYTMKILSPTSYTMKYEMSQDGTNWMTVMEGSGTKK